MTSPLWCHPGWLVMPFLLMHQKTVLTILIQTPRYSLTSVVLIYNLKNRNWMETSRVTTYKHIQNKEPLDHLSLCARVVNKPFYKQHVQNLPEYLVGFLFFISGTILLMDKKAASGGSRALTGKKEVSSEHYPNSQTQKRGCGVHAWGGREDTDMPLPYIPVQQQEPQPTLSSRVESVPMVSLFVTAIFI